MKIDILTLFPEMFNSLNASIIGKAVEKNLIEINTINIRDYSKDKHKKVDDSPYGGGAGMVIKPDVVYNSYISIPKTENSKTIYLSPKGNVLTQKRVKELSKEEHLILICGHYEGIDQRAIDKIVDDEISIGDYILTGGELPAMVLIDSVTRYCARSIKSRFSKRRIFFRRTFRISTVYKTRNIFRYESTRSAIIRKS
jgi:tRNA (guanine37-N1)-methyltransferase